MNILFAHRFFPTQFRHLANALAANSQNRVVAISHPAEGDTLHTGMPDGANVRLVSYGNHLPQKPFAVPRHTRPLIEDMYTATAVFNCARTLLKEERFVPDLVISNALWGEGLYLRELFPNAKFLTHLELFYRTDRGYGFDEPNSAEQGRIFPMLSKNASIALAAASMDWGIASLEWERDQFPGVFHPKISVIHEGIDTDTIAPGPSHVTIGGKGIRLSAGDEIVTYAARLFEPLRGSENFFRAIPAILKRRPNAHIVVVGSEVKGKNVASKLISELEARYDPTRLHFVGRLEHAEFLDLLRLSSVHVYLSAPFILSWSFLEAMACECAIVASNNPPVSEIVDGVPCGLFVDFFDPQAIAEATVALLADELARKKCASAARQTIVDRFDLHSVCLPQQLSLIERLVAGEME